MSEHKGPHDEVHAHHSHQYPWPFVTAAGLTLAFFGLIPFLQKQPIGFLFLGSGALLFLWGLVVWLAHIIREHVAVVKNGVDYENARRGTWFVYFLVLSETFLFGTLFAAYFYLRNHDWVNSQSTNHFYLVDGEVMSPMGIVVILNTIFLVISSFTLHFSEEALKHGKYRLFQILLGISILLGAVFVAGQVIEFVEFAHEGFTIASGTFGASFFLLTGLHGAHVFAGALLLCFLFIGSCMRMFSPERHVALKVISIYWHFVDVIWLILVGILYMRLI